MLSHDFIGFLVVIILFNYFIIRKIKIKINVIIDHVNKLEKEVDF